MGLKDSAAKDSVAPVYLVCDKIQYAAMISPSPVGLFILEYPPVILNIFSDSNLRLTIRPTINSQRYDSD